MCLQIINKIILVAIVFSQTVCNAQVDDYIEYPENVGDILFNPDTDRFDFKICNKKNIKQYYNFNQATQIDCEKSGIYKYFKQNYDTSIVVKESGYITIRFIVNCKAETGCFRVIEMNNNYQPTCFDSNIVEQILRLTKQLSGWKIGVIDGEQYDYYQYLTFKLSDGLIQEIMP